MVREVDTACHKVDPLEHKDGRTELMNWSWEGVPQAVEHLIKIGADVNAMDKQGQTALFYAVQGYGDADVIQTLKNAGADFNVQDNEQNTALMNVFQRVNQGAIAGIVESLVSGGTNVNTPNNVGHTIVMRAAFFHREDIAQFLIGSGADPSARSNLGRTLSDFAHHDRRTTYAKRFKRMESLHPDESKGLPPEATDTTGPSKGR